MSTTTERPALTGVAIADGLRQLADLIEHTSLIAARTHPGQSFRVSELVDTEQDVLDLAADFGLSVERDGSRRTSVTLGLGDGVEPDPRFGPVWNSAVTLQVSHITEETAR